MAEPNNINSGVYWDERFSENWETFDGPRQSRFFSTLAIEHLPRWLIEQIRQERLTLADWGCAQGDGSDAWLRSIRAEQVTGVDFSSVAIGQAKERYPALRFLHSDWLAGDGEAELFDIVFSSNTLEHFHKPFETLDVLCSHARKAVVLMLPYKEENRIDEHFFSFYPENIPTRLLNGFRLFWSKVIDCRNIPNTQWSGYQIALVFADPAWVDEFVSRLVDIHITDDDAADQARRSAEELRQRDQRIADMLDVVDGRITQLGESIGASTRNLASEAEHHLEQIMELARSAQSSRLEIGALAREVEVGKIRLEAVSADLQRAQSEAAEKDRDALQKAERIEELLKDSAAKDSKLSAAEAYRVDKEIYIAQLLLDIKARDESLAGHARRVLNKVARIPYFILRSLQILRKDGAKGLARGVKEKLRRRYMANSVGVTSSATSVTPMDTQTRAPMLLGDELVVLTGVPFDDVGGGQRAAQLARCALRTGRKVVYIYIYPKYDFVTRQYAESELNIPGLTHLLIDDIKPIDLLGMISPSATVLMELPHPKILPFLDICRMRGLRTVFELIDDWETSLGGDWFNMDVYGQFVQRSEVVVGTAALLVKRLMDMGRIDALYLPNASNECIFDKYRSFSRPADLPTRGRRRAIYFGSLYGEWLAWDWIVGAAERNGDIDFVLIGDCPEKTGLPSNIYLLGAKRIEELPGYLQHSDIALLPFVPGKISDAVSPIKVFEYLFVGKPVVSTRLPEIVNYPGVHIADSMEQFAELCRDVHQTKELGQDNDRFIARNSWFFRLDQIVGDASIRKYASTISAVILIHNNKDIIGRCLESLLLHGATLLHEVIVIDNASSDGGADYVREHFPSVKVVSNPVNGCASGRNLGVALAGGQYLAFFDSDQWFTSTSCFVEALQVLTGNAHVGAVGWAAGWFDRSRDDLGGMITDYCYNRGMNSEALAKGYRSDIGYLGTGGFFMPKHVFESTGGFDVFYDPTCFEDTDMSFQIKKLGLSIAFRDLTGIRHQPHQTTKAGAQSDGYKRLFQRNATYFKEKWESYPQFFADYPGH